MIAPSKVFPWCWVIDCDVPNCAATQILRVAGLLQVKDRMSIEMRQNIALTEAERTFNWFLELMPDKNEVVLVRHICPTHAPAYRAMLQAYISRVDSKDT